MSDLSGRPYTGWPSSVIAPSIPVRDTSTGKKEAPTTTADPKSDPERFSTELFPVAGYAIRGVDGDHNSKNRP